MKLECPNERMSEAHRCAMKDIASDERAKLEGAGDLIALKLPADQDVVSRTLRSHWPFPSTVGLVPSVRCILLHQLIEIGISISRACQDPVFPRAPPSSCVEGYQYLDCHSFDRGPNPCPELHSQSQCTFGHRDRIHRSVCDRFRVVDWG